VIANLAFAPATLTVPVGTRVTWRNNDSVIHTVNSRDNLFNSPSLSSGGTFSFTFTQRGTFVYYCAIHPYMEGRVIVE
jgi:plastocyanin